MKASVTSGLVIGYEVPASEAVKEQKERGCDHKLRKSAKFCPECGAPMWKESGEPVLVDNLVLDGQFDVFVATHADKGTTRYYVGKWYSEFISIPDLAKYDFNELRADLRRELKDLGINPDECAFGLHVATSFGY